jgi:oligoendopeptidase F
MTQDLLQDWQMLYAIAVSDGESGQISAALEQAETAIKRRFEEESDTLSALEEAKLYSALRTLQRLKAEFVNSP